MLWPPIVIGPGWLAERLVQLDMMDAHVKAIFQPCLRSHQESVPVERIQPLVQDALDSIEFITGPPDSRWGALRAAMGHPAPWALTYMGIGNEVGAAPPLLGGRALSCSGSIKVPCTGIGMPSLTCLSPAVHCQSHIDTLHAGVSRAA